MNLTVADGFPYYISLVGSSDAKQLLRAEANFGMLSSLTEDQLNYRYAADKWNIKQIIGHMADHERIMMYRTLRFSRNDSTLLPGYDQDLMVKNSRFHEMKGKDLIDDFRNVRKATISLMDSFSDEQLQRKGIAWKFELTVEEMLKATIGHELHHMSVMKQRYFNS
jgi:uncharacterized damage-inducible protein DinB